MDETVKCKVKLPRQLLDNLAKIKSADPNVSTAEEHLRNALKLYVLLAECHKDGKSFYLGKDPGSVERLVLFG